MKRYEIQESGPFGDATVNDLLHTLTRMISDSPEIASYTLIYDSVNHMEETLSFAAVQVDHDARTAELTHA